MDRHDPQSVVRQMLRASVISLGAKPTLRVVEPEDRFTLHAWAHGYVIRDRGSLIATFHGPQFDLASKTLRSLRDDAARIPEPQDAA